jgi:hypothetical protein
MQGPGRHWPGSVPEEDSNVSTVSTESASTAQTAELEHGDNGEDSEGEARSTQSVANKRRHLGRTYRARQEEASDERMNQLLRMSSL